jgi:pantoate--beta-alanine ligase
MIAGKLNVILKSTLAKIKQGDIESALKNAKKLLTDAGFTKIDYVELRESDTLETTITTSPETRIFAAVWIGKTRLIDNFSVGEIGRVAPLGAKPVGGAS